MKRKIEDIERDLAAARERYRRDGPRHEHVRDCEKFHDELIAAKKGDE